MRIRFFGTYDERKHPRVRVLREGLQELYQVRVDNLPVAIDTATRVEALRQPARLLRLAPALLWTWVRLAVRGVHGPRPHVVIVGHLGHFDIVVARLLFPRAILMLDYMISVADTARDREVGDRGIVLRLLQLLDRMATFIADIVLVDTPENLETVPPRSRHKAVAVPVGADVSWFAASDAKEHTHASDQSEGLSVVFFGLYTPLQGAPVIGAALRELHRRGTKVTATMIGTGQERSLTEAASGDAPVTWIDWLDANQLPSVVARHDVCLGIFGVGPKARRVVPNKAYQGAAAGCIVVTSDTGPQRRALPVARFVPAGDQAALADLLEALATSTDTSATRLATRDYARAHFGPDKVVAPLVEVIGARFASRRSRRGPSLQ